MTNRKKPAMSLSMETAITLEGWRRAREAEEAEGKPDPVFVPVRGEAWWV